MMEEAILNRILLNLGTDAPWLLVVWMLIWRVWPGVQGLLENYLQKRQPSSNTNTITVCLDDSVQELVNALVGLVQAVAPSAAAAVSGSQSPVSPMQSGSSEASRSAGGAVSDRGTGA